MDLLLLEEAMLRADWLAALICAISRRFYLFLTGNKNLQNRRNNDPDWINKKKNEMECE